MNKHSIIAIVTVFIFNNGYCLAKQYEFDYRELNLINKNDINSLKNTTPPGNYVVDIYLNNELKETSEVYFKKKSESIEPCLTKEMLIKYSLSHKKISDFTFDNEECLIFNNSEINYDYNYSNQTLLLKMPSFFLSAKNTEIEDEALWDNGINAMLINYSASYQLADKMNAESYFSQIEPGFNYGAWRVRNLSTWKKNKYNSKFESAFTYVERGIDSLKSRLVIGDKYTTSDIFDSMSYRGISLSKDENMIPYTMKTYFPKITGIAKSQSTVEIRQNGYLLYSTSVPSGEFEISAAKFPRVGSGLIDVTIIESNGQRQIYSVPYTAPVISLPEGYSKYSITTGNFRDNYSNTRPFFFEGTYSYGFPYELSFFGGGQLSNIYNAYAIGLSKDMGLFGALSFDWKSANSKEKPKKTFKNGNALGVRYNKNIPQTNTAVSLASHYFYSKEFRTLSETVESYSIFRRSDNKKSTTTASLTQPLRDLGVISLNYNHNTYWNSRDRNSITGRYTKSIDGIFLSLSYTKNEVQHAGKKNSEDLFNLSIYIPLNSSKMDMYTNYQLTTSSESQTTNDFGLSGLAFDRRLNWNVRETISDGTKQKKYSYMNASWRGVYGEAGGYYSYSNLGRNIGFNTSGGILAHEEGVTFGQRIPNTAALVEAKGVSGAKIIGSRGIKTDFRGYTISGSLTPYGSNFISIDPVSLPNDSDIRKTDIQVVPTSGAIVKAKYTTNIGINALIKAVDLNGKPLPFGSIVSIKDKKGVIQSTSIVGDNGEVYLSGINSEQTLTASWGRDKSENCILTFTHPDNLPKNQPVILLNGICK